MSLKDTAVDIPNANDIFRDVSIDSFVTYNTDQTTMDMLCAYEGGCIVGIAYNKRDLEKRYAHRGRRFIGRKIRRIGRAVRRIAKRMGPTP